MTVKNKSELVKQIEAYGLKGKLADLAHKEQARRPFRHLPKQFSKGILIGNIAIVPKKHTGTRYVYVIADMMEAQLLHEDINLKPDCNPSGTLLGRRKGSAKKYY